LYQGTVLVPELELGTLELGTLELGTGVVVPADGEVPIEGVLPLEGGEVFGVVEVELLTPVPPRPPVAAPVAGAGLSVVLGLTVAAELELIGAVGSRPPPPLAPCILLVSKSA
jgi:hypothetical protein